MGRKRKNKGSGRKKVSYTEIPMTTESGDKTTEYVLLDRMVSRHHPDLADAKIVLIWRDGWKPDKDFHQTLGKCKKASDFDKELGNFDFAIILNRQAWNLLEANQREALIDHELCHAAPDLDAESGEQKEDERGRKVWRIRKHDIEEFTDIVKRHGLYKADLEAFVKTAARKAGRSLFEGESEEAA